MAPGRHAYRIWGDDRIIPNKLREGFNGFVIRIELRHYLQRAKGDDYVLIDKIKNFFVWPVIEHNDGVLKNCFYLPNPIRGKKKITNTYPSVDLPERVKLLVLGTMLTYDRIDVPDKIKEMVADDVSSLVKSKWNNGKNQAGVRTAMPISVEVTARTLRQPNETEQEGITRACTEFTKSFLDSKASEECVSCIKAVEYVRLEGLSSIKKCAICYREYYAGTVVGRLPCSHVYHANCIISQLAREANFCVRCHGA